MSMKRTLLSSLTSVLAAMSVSSAVFAQDIFIKDATVVIANGTSPDTDVLIQKGRITQIGTDLTAPAGIAVHDGAGHWVSPGLFAPFSSLGLVEVGAEDSTNDSRAVKAKTSISELAVDSFNPRSTHIAIARRRGVTHALVTGSTSGDSIFAGTGLIANTTGSFDSVLQEKAFVHVALGETGADRAGGSRSAALAQLRGSLSDSRNYRTRLEGPSDGDVLSRQDAAALYRAASGDIPLLITAHRASDLMGIMRLKRDIPTLDIIIVGASEAWIVADELAQAKIKVIVDPVMNLPEAFESLGANYQNVLILETAGVDYAIANLTALGVTKTQSLAQHAGNAVGNGLDWDKAFAAISETPARWFGMRVSTVQVGPLDDLIVWDGDPLEATSAPIKIWIDGEEQSLQSRQTLLRDRYNPTSTDTRPHKYR